MRCEYRGRDESSFDSSSLAILDRLSVLESLMRQHNCASLPVTSPSYSHPSPVIETSRSLNTFDHHEHTHGVSRPTSPSKIWDLHTGSEGRVRLDTILKWSIFEKPLSSLRRFPFLTIKKEHDYTYLEVMSGTPNDASPLSIYTDPVEVERLMDRFFILVHVKNPILDRETVKQYCLEYCENGPAFNLRSGLILLICALASVAPDYYPKGPLGPNHGQSRWRPNGSDLAMGKCYFAAAEQRLGAAMTQHTSLAVQCLCLAGIYHMYMVDPIAGHAMFHHAGYILQMVASTGENTSDGSPQIDSSLYWACSKSEREIFAEIPRAIPALGRPSNSNSYPLPPQERFMTWGGNNDLWAQAEQDSWYFFLSEIALRRIMDKAAEDVGNFFDSVATSSCDVVQLRLEEFAPVAVELERQAFAWREHLPPNTQFVDAPEPAQTEWKLYSRQPFYSTLELMYRPFLFAFVHGLASGPLVRNLANKALGYAQQYLQGCNPTHAHHGRALQLRKELRMVVLLFAACGRGLEMPLGWYDDVRAVVRSFRYWEPAVPWLRSYINVVLALDGYFKGSETECIGVVNMDLGTKMETIMEMEMAV